MHVLQDRTAMAASRAHLTPRLRQLRNVHVFFSMAAVLFCIYITQTVCLASLTAFFRMKSAHRSLRSPAALPWDTAGIARGEKAYAVWAQEYQEVAANGKFMGTACDKGSIVERFEVLEQLTGSETAMEIISKDPVVLMWGADSLRTTWAALKRLELEQGGQDTAALNIVKKNPRLLTVPAPDLRNSLMFYDVSASVLDVLRPLGPLGPFMLRPLGIYILITGFNFALKAFQTLAK
eukprot:TRINITY_DN40761_c0_g1_i1.p1 TRINITY_DN40761_c0_g1~~TRINITY_DN40761_c0_g1_i1.p1  ORF type:complete len:236 (+),score=37.24 TRINITY_DN40761_c0_g1_i1:87-794(+)